MKISAFLCHSDKSSTRNPKQSGRSRMQKDRAGGERPVFRTDERSYLLTDFLFCRLSYCYFWYCGLRLNYMAYAKHRIQV